MFFKKVVGGEAKFLNALRAKISEGRWSPLYKREAPSSFVGLLSGVRLGAF